MTHTFLITGASAGIGLALGMTALQAGHKVIGTGRNAMKAAATNPRFEEAGGEWLSLDVNQKEAQQIVEKVIREKGVDIVVNNAGYSLLGAAEAMSDDEIHAQFNTNVYGMMRVTRGALPVMRERKAGTIVNVSSLVGISNKPSCSIYGATKFALEGFSEALAQEVAPWNIRVLIIQPGAFRTRFLNVLEAAAAGMPAGYEGTPAAKAMDMYGVTDGKQPGDVEKAAPRMLDVITSTGMGEGLGRLMRMPVGDDALSVATAKADELVDNFRQMEKVASGVGHDD